MLEQAALHKKKIAVGTLIAIVGFGYPHAQRVFKWYGKVGETRHIAKDNEDKIEKLSECERRAAENIIRLEEMIEDAKDRLNKLEYKIDKYGR